MVDLAVHPLRARLGHMLWIGGGSGAGKTTIARQLADRHGMRLYHPEPPSKYLPRSTPRSSPLLHSFVAMDMDERWVNRSPQVMYETFHAFHGECFDLVIDDLLALPGQQPILVEGFSLLPRLVAPLVSRSSQAVWLLPSPSFRRAALNQRGSTWAIPNKTSDPEKALENLLARDEIFTDELRRETTTRHLHAIEVDGSLTIDASVRLVGAALGLGVDRDDNAPAEPAQ